MERQRARHSKSLPGEAVALTVSGEVFPSGLITSSMMRIDDAAEHTDGSVKVKLRKKHGFANDNPIPLHVRAGGWHGVTERAHPANGNERSARRIDDRWLALEGTQWAANSNFLHGVCWLSSAPPVDARAILQALIDKVADAGGGIVELPPGWIALSGTLLMRDGVFLVGAAGDLTNFFALDGMNAHVLQSVGAGEFHARGFTIWGNRQYQDPTKGFHAFRFGLDATAIRNVVLDDIIIRGSAGYGIGLQSAGWFDGFIIRRVRIVETDSDGIDIKNRANDNDANDIEHLTVEHFGLYRIGVDGPAFVLAATPFTMEAGSKIVTVAHVGNGFSPGIKVTFDAGIVRGVNMSGTGTITGKIPNGFRIEMNEAAASSGTGGGTGIREWASQFSNGDAGLDLRGRGFHVGVLRVKGDMRGRSGLRGRPGDELAPNGLGGVWFIADAVFIENTHASRTNANGATVGGRGAIIKALQGANLNQCLNVQVNALGNIIESVAAVNCNTAAALRGNKNVLKALFADTCGTALAIQGGTVVDRDYLPVDAFTTTAGSNVVIVNSPGHDHETGDDVLFMYVDASDLGGIDPNNDPDTNPTWEITKIDADRYSFVALNAATANKTGGGENAIYSFGQVQAGEGLVAGNINTRGCTVDIAIGTGAEGAQIIGWPANDDGFVVNDEGSGTVFLPAAA